MKELRNFYPFVCLFVAQYPGLVRLNGKLIIGTNITMFRSIDRSINRSIYLSVCCRCIRLAIKYWFICTHLMLSFIFLFKNLAPSLCRVNGCWFVARWHSLIFSAYKRMASPLLDCKADRMNSKIDHLHGKRRASFYYQFHHCQLLIIFL